MACGTARILVTARLPVNHPDTTGLRALFRLLALAYFAFLNWQLFTPVTLVAAGDWDKAYHAAAFMALAGLLTTLWRGVTPARWIALLLAYAALTEVIQYFIPGRAFSVGDWVADALGVMLGVALSRVFSQRFLPAAIRTQ